MNSELENLLLTICPHEEANKQEKTRIKSVTDWATLYGICDIQHKELPECDYRLEGEFRGVTVELNVEFKAWDNFLSDPIDDMEDHLTRAQEYGEVALFVEQGNYTFKPDPQGVHCILEYTEHAKAGFRLQSQKLGRVIEPPTKTLAAMEGFFDTLQSNGIRVRTLRSEAHFPYALHNLLIYLTKPHQLKVKKLSYDAWLINMYMNLPEVGYIRAKKLIEAYPNPFWLCSAGEDALIRTLGKTTGQVVYQHLRNHELETDIWKGLHNKDGTAGNNAEPEPVRVCSKCGKNTFKSACPRCDKDGQSAKASKDRVKQETYIKQDTEVNLCNTCTKKPDNCGMTSDDRLLKGDTVVLCVGHVEGKSIDEVHLCKTCTKEKNGCDTTNNSNVLRSNNVSWLQCDMYINKYPPKPLSPEAKKHQEFKRMKAGFQPKGTCETCDFHITDKLICLKQPAKRAEKHYKACAQYIQKSVLQKSASGSQPPDLSKSSSTGKPDIPPTLSTLDSSKSSSTVSPTQADRNGTPDPFTKKVSSHSGEDFSKVTPINTPIQSSPADMSSGQPGTKGSLEVLVVACDHCGAESNTCAVSYYKRYEATLCQSCANVEDEGIKEQHKEIAEEILKYLRESGGKMHSEICQHFNLAIGSPDCKDMRNCLKKMAEAGLITSEHGVFIVVQTKDSMQSHTPASNEGAVYSSTPLTSSFNPDHVSDLQSDLRAWFYEPHTLTETAKHISGSTREYVFNMIMQMEEQGALRRFAADGETKWTVAVKAQPEMDIGV
ncbi:MAG: hypothetical protein PHH85_09040 [Candidatus Methanoperedens sp.]|nr:hypothetical protein [Candidatus Methanoperedens sp.]